MLLSSYKWNKILPLFFPCYKERCSWVVKLANVEYFCARAMNIYLINRAGGYHDSWVIFPLTRQITYRANQCLQLYVDHISRRLQFLTSLLSRSPNKHRLPIRQSQNHKKIFTVPLVWKASKRLVCIHLGQSFHNILVWLMSKAAITVVSEKNIITAKYAHHN